MSRQRAIDVGVALGVFVADGGAACHAAGFPATRTRGASTSSASSSLLRPRCPWSCGGVRPWPSSRRSAIASVALNALHYPPGPPIGSMVALYFVGLSGDRDADRRTAHCRGRDRPLRRSHHGGRLRARRGAGNPGSVRRSGLGRSLGARRPRPPAARARQRRSRSAPARPSERPIANDGSPRPRSERGSRATCTTRRGTRST